MLTFDRLVPTGTSMLYALRLVPKGTSERCNLLMQVSERNEGSGRTRIENPTSSDSEPVKKVTSAKTKISKQQAHYLFSHMGPRSAIASAKHFGQYDVIPGGIIMCEPCMIAKSKRAVIPKTGWKTCFK